MYDVYIYIFYELLTIECSVTVGNNFIPHTYRTCYLKYFKL